MMSPWIFHLNWRISLKIRNLLFALTAGIVAMVLISNETIYYLYHKNFAHHVIGRRQVYEYVMNISSLDNDNTLHEYLVDTSGCKIPNINPLDPSVANFTKPLPPIQCNYTPPITYTDGLYLRINKTVLTLYYEHELSYCGYEEIYKPSNVKSDNEIRFRKPTIYFKLDVKVTCEFIRLACYDVSGDMIYSNFHAFIQPRLPKPDYRSFKLNHTAAPSILMIGIDSVSRLNFMRQMSETRQFLLNTMNAFELNGFNKVADNTLVNLSPMLAGKYLQELPWEEYKHDISPFDQYNFIWKQYQSHGYTTLFAEDAPDIAIFNYMKEGFYEKPADYYLRPYSLAMERHSSLWNSNHDCFRDKPETQIVLDWSRDFLMSYKTQPYFAFLFLTRLTHEDINKAGSADKIYREYLESLYNEGVLDNTIILFYSDHGMRFGAIRQTHIGKLEERLPFFFITLPTNYKKSLSKHKLESIITNQNALTTPFDIYETLLDILHSSDTSDTSSSYIDGEGKGQHQKKGTSLFSVISKDRSCDSAGIDPHWCACHQTIHVNTLDPVIVKASMYVVQYINQKLQPVSEYCEFLNLESIEDALYIWGDTHSHDSDFVYNSSQVSQQYLITFTVMPGGGVFEVTISYNTGDSSVYNILGGPSRISRYGHHGKCIKTHSLQKYCYCRE